jgi:hypothetical protein
MRVLKDVSLPLLILIILIQLLVPGSVEAEVKVVSSLGLHNDISTVEKFQASVTYLQILSLCVALRLGDPNNKVPGQHHG